MANPSQFEVVHQYNYMVASTTIASSVADTYFFVAPAVCTVVGISAVHAVAGDDSGAVSGTIRRCQGTEAPASGDDLLGTTKINFKATANTVQSPELTGTTANLTLAAGDRLALDVTGTTTNLAGVTITVLLQHA